LSDYSDYFDVVYEDNHLIVVNKQSGVLVQGDKTGDAPLSDYVKEYLKEKYNKPGNVFAGVVHRLDRPVSGLVILARTSKALERMNQLFKDREIQKTYWALVKNKPKAEEGKLIHWLIKDTEKNITTAHNKDIKEGQKSELTYQLLERINDYYLLEVKPLTGRPHQIRVQLASMGCPIKGDVKYGYKDISGDGSISLHARKVRFMHPVKKELLSVTAPLPGNESWKAFRKALESRIDTESLENFE